MCDLWGQYIELDENEYENDQQEPVLCENVISERLSCHEERLSCHHDTLNEDEPFNANALFIEELPLTDPLLIPDALECFQCDSHVITVNEIADDEQENVPNGLSAAYLALSNAVVVTVYLLACMVVLL